MQLLIVDGEPPNRELLEGMARSLGYRYDTAASSVEALDKIGDNIDLVLLDAMMPDMDGYEVCRRIRAGRHAHDVPIVMVTALSDQEDRLRAVEAGADDTVTRPVDRAELRVRVDSLLKRKSARDAVKRRQEDLEELVARRTTDLCQALVDLGEAHRRTHEAHLETIYRLAVAAEYRDGHTHAHIERVGHYCALLGQALRLPPGEVETLYRASPMHDVGKLALADSILLKPGPLTPEERAVMQEHTVLGARILSGSSSTLLNAGEVIAECHHERWDGTGYPHGLSGEDIPLHGRICAVADVFDALTSVRPYKKAFPTEQAFEILCRDRGTHFDPVLVDLFLADHNKVLGIYRKFGPGA